MHIIGIRIAKVKMDHYVVLVINCVIFASVDNKRLC